MLETVPDTELQVLKPCERTLDEIADHIRKTQVSLVNNAANVLSDAISIGEDLLEAETIVPVGEFTRWCEENVAMASGNRANYMRLAFFKDKLPRHILEPAAVIPNGRLTATSREPAAIGPALRYIRALGVRRPHAFQPSTFQKREDIADIRELLANGISRREVARLLGVSKSTVDRAAMTPQQYKERMLQKRRALKRRQSALRKAEQLEGMRNAKPDLAEAYSLLRRCLQHAQAAHETYRPGNARKTVGSAMSYLHKAEDALARAAKLAELEVL